MKFFFVCFISVCVMGCAASGPSYHQQVINEITSPQFVIFRQKAFVGSLNCYKVEVNGKVVGKLANGGFLRVPVSFGLNQVSIPLGSKSLTIDVDASAPEEYFFEYVINSQGITPAGGVSVMEFGLSLSRVNASYAMVALSGVKESSPKCLAL